MVGREAPFRPFSGQEAPISLNFSNWHPFFEFFFNPLFRKKSGAIESNARDHDSSSSRSQWAGHGPKDKKKILYTNIKVLQFSIQICKIKSDYTIVHLMTRSSK
jgi:hypothetical protein